jgi:hypothetical protein
MTKDTNNRALNILTHILALFFSFLAPLIILIVSEDKLTKKHSREALNWQISLIIYEIISVILMLVLVGFVLLFVVEILNLIFCIMAAIRASEGNFYKYPLTIKFLKV